MQVFVTYCARFMIDSFSVMLSDYLLTFLLTLKDINKKSTRKTRNDYNASRIGDKLEFHYSGWYLSDLSISPTKILGLLTLRPVYSLTETVFSSPPISINDGQFVVTYPLKFIWVKHTRVATLIVATIYLQLIQNRYMFRSFTVLQCSH